MPKIQLIEKDGVPYRYWVDYIDHGKDGVTKVEVLDPCVTEEQQARRLKRIEETIQDIWRQREYQCFHQGGEEA